MKKKFSLRKKLIPILILLAIIPAIITSSFSMYEASNLVTGKVNQLTKQLSMELATNVDTFIGNIENQVNVISTLPDVINLNKSQITPTITAVANPNKSILSLYVGTQNKEMYGYIAGSLPAGFDPTSRPWYIDAVAASGSFVISKPYKDKGTGKMVFTISKSVVLANGEQAVVAGDVDLSILLEDISKVKVGETGYATLIQSDGITLVHPDKSMVLTNIADKFAWGKEILTNKRGNLEYTINGAKKIMGYQDSNLTGWIATASLPEKEYGKDLKSATFTIIIIIIFVLLLAALFGFLIANYVIKPLIRLKDFMKKAENGDYTIDIKTTRNDEIGEIENSFKNLIATQRKVIAGIINSSEELIKASSNMMIMSKDSVNAISNISESIESISSSTENNAASLEEANAGIEEMASNSQTVAQTIHKVKENSETSINIANSGYSSVNAATSSIEKIKSAAGEVSTVVDELYGSSQEIDTIVNAITSIASQTNLLALNAAIEAARAGDAGRGFAVVADEVRKLAEESNHAANSISKLIEHIQTKINDAVNTTKNEIRFVEEGINSTSIVKTSLEEIISSIKLVDKHIEEVASAAEEQSAAAQEMSAVVNNINNAIEETVNNTETMGIAARNQNNTIISLENSANELEVIAKKLASQTTNFKI